MGVVRADPLLQYHWFEGITLGARLDLIYHLLSLCLQPSP